LVISIDERMLGPGETVNSFAQRRDRPAYNMHFLLQAVNTSFGFIGYLGKGIFFQIVFLSWRGKY
jgi:hypothetical protein